MPTLYETIKHWADGQNRVNGNGEAQREAMHIAVSALMGSLRQYVSLADLAVGYYTDDQRWRRIGEEFVLSKEEADAVRKAAHWQRFMEIRHARGAHKK